MGLAKGIFMMDTHVMGTGMSGGSGERETELLYHMDRYDINMCVLCNLVPGINKHNADMVKKHPDRFIAVCNDEQTQIKNTNGTEKWTVEAAVKELDELLSSGLYSGVGVGMPRDRTMKKKILDWEERLDQICQFFELAKKYDFPISWHTGIPVATMAARDMARSRAHYESSDNGNPLLVHELATLYPDVPIILNHGGIEASGYYMEDYERCLNVAASHHNVFVETGQWWAELYEKPLKDPNIGAKKLIWGCAWGQTSNLQQIWMPGCVPETCCQLPIEQDPSNHHPDIWGWSLRQLGRLNVPQDDINLILGGNAAFLYKIKTPLPHERMFKNVKRKYIKE